MEYGFAAGGLPWRGAWMQRYYCMESGPMVYANERRRRELSRYSLLLRPAGMEAPLMGENKEPLRPWRGESALLDAGSDGAWAPMRVRLPPLLWRWLALAGAPALGSGRNIHQTLRRGWRHFTTLSVLAYAGTYAALLICLH